jgi:hypothetical protein
VSSRLLRLLQFFLASSSSLPFFPPHPNSNVFSILFGLCILLMKSVFFEIRVLEIPVLFLLLMMMMLRIAVDLLVSLFGIPLCFVFLIFRFWGLQQ